MIKWALIYIVMNGHNVSAINAYGHGTYFATMTECFEARGALGVRLTGSSGYFPRGSQAVCVPIEGEPT
jgi:hypothetical protein